MKEKEEKNPVSQKQKTEPSAVIVGYFLKILERGSFEKQPKLTIVRALSK